MTDPQELLSTLAEKLKRADRWNTREKIILLDALKNRFGSEVITAYRAKTSTDRKQG